MSVAIKKVHGVDSVKVSLEKGTAEIKLKPDNRVTVEHIREIIHSNGFTPKGSQVRVAGKLTERSGKPALEVTGLDTVYLLAVLPESKATLTDLGRLTGKQVVLSGEVPESKVDTLEQPRTLFVRQVEMGP